MKRRWLPMSGRPTPSCRATVRLSTAGPPSASTGTQTVEHRRAGAAQAAQIGHALAHHGAAGPQTQGAARHDAERRQQDDAGDLGARLGKLGGDGDDQRPGADDGGPVAGAHAMRLHHRLGAAGVENAGQGPAGEGNRALADAGGEDQGVGLEDPRPSRPGRRAAGGRGRRRRRWRRSGSRRRRRGRRRRQGRPVFASAPRAVRHPRRPGRCPRGGRSGRRDAAPRR